MLLELSAAIGCPMHCPYCAAAKLARAYAGPRHMTLDVLGAALSNCPDRVPVSFAGFAEPLLNPDFAALLALVHANGSPAQVYTTGYLLSDIDIETIGRVQPHRLVLHLPDAEGRMNLPVTSLYVERLKRLVELVPHAEAVCYGALHPALVGLCDMRGSSLQSRAGNVASLPVVGAKRGPLRCRPAPALDHPVMLPDGRLVLCCQDYGLRHVLGNLAERPWSEIARGDGMTVLRRAMAEGGECLCRTCEYAEET